MQALTETLFIVDDDEAVRDSLRWLLEAHGYHVTTFSSAEEFLTGYIPGKQIACLILDIRMEGMSGLQLQEYLSAKNITLPLIFITGHGDITMAVSAIKKGAIDFIEKPFDNVALCKTVDKMFVQARLTQKPLTDSDRSIQELLARLTLREHQVLEQITSGKLNKQIALELKISIKTVEAHRSNLMEKLKASNSTDLIKIVLSNKLSTSS